GTGLEAAPALQLAGRGEPESPTARLLHGYDRLADGARLRAAWPFGAGRVEVEETLRIVRDAAGGRLVRELQLTGIPAGAAVLLRARMPKPGAIAATASTGAAESRPDGDRI